MAMSRRDDGSVFQRHDHPLCPPSDPRTHQRPDHRCYGHWVAAVTLPGGKKAVRYRRTKREALDVLRQLITERDKGALDSPKLTVEAWLEHWYKTTARTRVRPSTLRSYRSKIDHHLVPALGSRTVASVKPSDLERMYADMLERGLAPRTIQQTHAILHNALSKAVKEGLIDRNPADQADTPPVRRESVTVLDVASVAAVLDEAAKLRMAARWHAALKLGLRQGEALGLQWSDVDLLRGMVTVRRSLQRVKGRGLVEQPPKSRAGYRTIPMTADTLQAFVAWRDQQDSERKNALDVWANDRDYVFTQESGRPVDPRMDWEAWGELLDRAGVPRVRLHDARHTAITMWLLAGVDLHTAKTWAGHSGIGITSDTYGGFVAEMHEKGLAALNQQRMVER